MAYERVMCPAAAGKLRCPLVEASLNLSFERPGLPDPPASPPRCWRLTDAVGRATDVIKVLAVAQSRHDVELVQAGPAPELPFRTSGDRFTSPILLHARR
jgi:hypothetical protein